MSETQEYTSDSELLEVIANQEKKIGALESELSENAESFNAVIERQQGVIDNMLIEKQAKDAVLLQLSAICSGIEKILSGGIDLLSFRPRVERTAEQNGN